MISIYIRNIRRRTKACCSSDQKIQQNGARALVIHTEAGLKSVEAVLHLAAQLQQRGAALLHTGGEVVAHLSSGSASSSGPPSFTFTAMMLATRLESEAAGLDSISSEAAWSKCGLSKTLQ